MNLNHGIIPLVVINRMNLNHGIIPLVVIKMNLNHETIPPVVINKIIMNREDLLTPHNREIITHPRLILPTIKNVVEVLILLMKMIGMKMMMNGFKIKPFHLVPKYSSKMELNLWNSNGIFNSQSGAKTIWLSPQNFSGLG
jgi:hypothetical protein